MRKPNVLMVSIDTQFDFIMVNGLLSVRGAERIIAPGIRYLAALDPDEVAGVLFTFDTHTREKYIGSLENLGDKAAGIPGFTLHCEDGTPGWANVFNFDIIPKRIPLHTLTKGVFDMWAEETRRQEEDDGAGWINHLEDRGWNSSMSTARDEWMEKLKSDGVDTVRIFGVASDYCLKLAIAGFLVRGFKVEVVGELTAGIERDIEQVVVDEFPGQVSII